MRPRPVVGKATIPDAVRRLLDKFDYPDRSSPEQVVPILPTLGAGGGVGAYVHLSRNATQSIASAGEPIDWDTKGLGISGFTVSLPTTTVTIEQEGYYNVAVQMGWSSFTGGGTITVKKNGVIVWAPVDDPGLWSASSGTLFEGTAHAIPCIGGDTIEVSVNPDDASAQTLASATCAVYLVDQALLSVDIGWTSPVRLAATSAATLAAYNTAAWNAAELREIGAAKYDPVTDLWVLIYTGSDVSSNDKLGIVTSSDGGATWSEGSNPITGGTEAEDGYLAKDVDGNVYRDGSGRALIYAEEKTADPHDHRGIVLWRSTADLLTGWTLFGRVIDRGAGGWDQTDRTSPVVIWDGTQYVMLFEGRNMSSQQGQIGYATSADGLTWAVDADPIITQGSTWNEVFVVCDDLIKIGTRWILLTHGEDSGGDFQSGRYETFDDPADWDASSFTELAGNPLDESPGVTCWGNDPRYVTYNNHARTAITKRLVVEG